MGIGVPSLLAGCLSSATSDDSPQDTEGDPGTSPAAKLDLEPVTDREIAKRISYRIDLDHREEERRAVASVVENGTTTITSEDRPVPDGRAVVYDGSVYETSVAVIDSSNATRFRFTLSEVNDADGEARSFTDLPPVDQSVFRSYGWEEGGPLELAGVPVVYQSDQIEASVLVPEPAVTTIELPDDTRVRITVE